MERKICTHCNIEKNIEDFTTNIQNVKFVIVIEVYNVTIRRKINYQIKRNIL